MKAAATGYPDLQRIGLARRFLVVLTALAFAFQAYIVQTHIHDVSVLSGGTVHVATSHSPSPGKTPLDHGATDCPFCQAVVHAGAFLTPATVALVLPFTWVKTLALSFAALAASSAAAHSWHSRAPPRR